MKKDISNTIILCLLLNAFSILSTSGQSVINALNIGDQCPDFEFTNILNYSSDKAKLSDFKGKLVILDFWATWCGPCIQALPKLESLQAQFKDKLVVLPVTYENKDMVKRFIGNNDLLKSVRLPFITNNTDLNEYFIHNTIPHEVWIDESGKVIATTNANEINANTVGDYLTNKGLPSKMKNDIMGEDHQKLMMMGFYGKDHNFDLNSIQYYSLISDEVPGASKSATKVADYADSLILVRHSNMLITGLYMNAFQAGRKFMNENPKFYLQQICRTVLEVKDSTHFFYNGIKDMEAFSRTKGINFNFEVVARRSDTSRINQLMVAELNRFFSKKYGISGFLEIRKVMCWILEKTDNKDLLRSKGGEPKILYGENYDSMYLRNVPFSKMVFDFTTHYFQRQLFPLIDETRYDGNIDISLSVNLRDPVAVSKALSKYGLRLRLAERYTEMIVIKDIK